jgi:phosphoglycolate phosphatase
MSKLIVFDVDGTILDSQGFFDKVIVHYSKEKGLPHPSLEAIKRGYNDPHKYDFGWGIPLEEQTPHMRAAFDLADSWAVQEHAEKPSLFSGVIDTLKHLRNQGHTLAIVTSKSEEPLLHTLRHHKIEDLFATHRNWADVKRRGEKAKPAPDKLNSVLRELNFNPSDAVMIGDTTMDIEMGRAANAHTIGVTWGAHPFDYLQKAGAHHIVDTHFNDIMPTIRKIFT